MKHAVKWILRAASLLVMFLPAALSAFGSWETGFALFAQSCAMVPGILGDYLRIAFYRLTLSECSLSSRVSFGSFFAHPEAKLGPKAYIGCFCIIGKAVIGERTQVASGVQILSGRRQHSRERQHRTDGKIDAAG